MNNTTQTAIYHDVVPVKNPSRGTTEFIITRNVVLKNKEIQTSIVVRGNVKFYADRQAAYRTLRRI